jgi:DNA-binding CsgD family transcriptional regulator
MALSTKDLLRFSKFVDTEGECWNWTGATTGTKECPRYGQFEIAGSFNLAHRLSFAEFNGPIPKRLMVLHKCNNKLCVRPDHLYLGTGADNQVDRMKDSGGVKLNERKVEVMRALSELTTLTKKEIALIFGVDYSTVSRILRYKYWAWVRPVYTYGD